MNQHCIHCRQSLVVVGDFAIHDHTDARSCIDPGGEHMFDDAGRALFATPKNRRFIVCPFLGVDFRDTHTGYNPKAEYIQAGLVEVLAQNEMDACEVAFAIYNSYPGELHCDSRYFAEVESYRAAENRSLSVGDYVTVDGVPYTCEHTGFKILEKGLDFAGA